MKLLLGLSALVTDISFNLTFVLNEIKSKNAGKTIKTQMQYWPSKRGIFLGLRAQNWSQKNPQKIAEYETYLNVSFTLKGVPNRI